MRIVIVGSTGGIGAALCRAYTADQNVTTIHALSRQGQLPRASKIQPYPVDILDEDSIIAAANHIAEQGSPDCVLVATGLLSQQSGLCPEKSYRQQTATAFETVFAVNTTGPALIAKHFLPLMPRRGRTVFAALSARVGSISDNRLGGWHAYRASKAALNMLLKNYALEQARRNGESIIVGLHPGTVDTALSAPFQTNLAPGKLFTADTAARRLIQVLAALRAEDSGQVFDWAGKSVAP